MSSAPPRSRSTGRGRARRREADRARARPHRGGAEREPDAPASPWDASDAFQLSGSAPLALPLIADGESVTAEIAYGAQGAAVGVGGEKPAADAFAVAAGDAVYVLRRGRQTKVDLARSRARRGGRCAAAAASCARPCTARCWPCWWSRARAVQRGQRLAIIEAMKMEHTLDRADRRHRGRDRRRARRPGGRRRQGHADRALGCLSAAQAPKIPRRELAPRWDF